MYVFPVIIFAQQFAFQVLLSRSYLYANNLVKSTSFAGEMWGPKSLNINPDSRLDLISQPPFDGSRLWSLRVGLTNL